MLQSGKLSFERYIESLPHLIRQTARERSRSATSLPRSSVIIQQHRRTFHDYFITHLPSSSLHPDSRSAGLLSSSKLPRDQSKPHTGSGQPAAHHPQSRDTTVVRIPLKGAKHHYGQFNSRGSRPYNEDSHQAGVIDLPAFARRPPKSVALDNRGLDETAGDPQVFYFGVFDGHGGAECSDFLRQNLHEYIEKTAKQFKLQSSLDTRGNEEAEPGLGELKAGKKVLDDIKVTEGGQTDDVSVSRLEKDLIQNWRVLVGGYFRRFKPAYFSIYPENHENEGRSEGAAIIEEVLTYAFLNLDYDFVSAQAEAEKRLRQAEHPERPINDEIHSFHEPNRGLVINQIAKKQFKGGSTCSVVLVSTPTPTPFWNPATSSSLIVAHVGDTRVLLCRTKTGEAVPLTTDHHPSAPLEANRLRRYAGAFVTDSFGEERLSGLANTRAFGDIGSKRLGVSAEPEIRRLELGAAEYSFLVLMSDGISGTLNDQEVVDIVKEAKTPEQASRDVVSFATEVSTEGDNATCLVVRLGGWERRQEGGKGSLGTKESRDYKRQDALDPRSSRR